MFIVFVIIILKTLPCLLLSYHSLLSLQTCSYLRFSCSTVLRIATLYAEWCPCLPAEYRILEIKAIEKDVVQFEQDHNPLTQLADQTELQFIKFRMLFIVLFLIYTILPSITSSPNSRSAAFTSMELFTTHIPSMCFSLFYTVYSMIFIKSEALSSFVALINAKSEYVRYISHELRTPLNVALIGIEMLTRELEVNTYLLLLRPVLVTCFLNPLLTALFAPAAVTDCLSD